MTPSVPFRMFGLQHLAVLFILLVFVILVVWGTKHMNAAAKARLGRVLGLLLVFYAAALYVQEATSGGLHGSYSLPMQLCDWVMIACVVTLFRPNRLCAEIAYFWGLGGTLQALLTPDVARGFPSWRFIQFFWGHGIALLCVVYIVVAQSFRPRPRSILRMMMALNIYALAALSLDLAFGWNYGYLRFKPQGLSLFDYLGPWPWYLLSLEAIALAIFWLLALPGKMLD